MSSLICPISSETIDKQASRGGATLTALLLVAYAISGAWPILFAVTADYVIRVLTPYRPPISMLSGRLLKAAKVGPHPMNKGPKVFAWRIGFVLAVVATLLLPVSPPASVAVAVMLAGFNVLDGILNLCVGCVIYTYLVLPYLGPTEARVH